MILRSRPVAAFGLVALALGVSACERGCLSRWLADRSLTPASGGEGPGGSAGRDGASSFDLGGTDCSDGLARCVDGRVETSVAGHIPHPCAAPREQPGSCECRWQAVARCTTGCFVDGFEVVATAEIARVQLCASTEPVLRPVLAREEMATTVCADERVWCTDGVVRLCTVPGQPSRVVAACANGCAAGVGIAASEALSADGPAGILCRRANAGGR